MSSPREDSMLHTATPSSRLEQAPSNADSTSSTTHRVGTDTAAPAPDASDVSVPRPAASAKSDSSRQISAPAALPKKKPSTASLVPGKVRQSEPSAQTMQVETETVHSIPQASVNSGSERPGGRGEASGAIRAKPSTETIRPKKEKRRASKKTPSIVSGPSTTKADLFEAKVASEIEGDDTDSDETFVYESEVPERRRRAKQHSRTPSTTSLASANERKNGLKSINSILDSHRVRAKRSMKFASSSYNPSSVDEESGDRDASQPTPRRHDGSHQHFGFFGRGPHSANLDESAYSQASKLRINSGAGSRSASRIHSPRSANFYKGADGFDYESGGGETERTPLVGSTRGVRGRTGGARRGVSTNLRPIDYYEDSRRPMLNRVAGCVVMTVMVILVLLGVAGFLFATTKPLTDAHIVEINNVLASEQEIMLDLEVEATNPNIATITITNVDFIISARTHDSNDDNEWYTKRLGHSRHPLRNHGPLRSSEAEHDLSINKWIPPWDDEPDDKQTLTLGRVVHMDSTLSFVGTPFRYIPSNSTGELRLEKPGKGIDEGIDRWKKMLKHPFELIVRGIVKYDLPLNSKELTISVRGGVLVHPEEGVDEFGAMRVEQLPQYSKHDHE